jgi:hypothetical protein
MSNIILPPGPAGFTLEAPALPEGVPPGPAGFTLEGGPTTAPTWADSIKDAGQTALPSLARGAAALAGTPGDAATGLNTGIDAAERAMGLAPDRALSDLIAPHPAAQYGTGKFSPSTQNISDATGVSGLYQPHSGLGKVTDSILQLAPGAVTGGANSLRQLGGNILRYAVAPGAVSEGAGELADKYLPSWASGPIRAATALATSAFGPRVVSPNWADPKLTANVGTLNDAGVTSIKAGQATNSRQLRTWEDVLSPHAVDDQQSQFTNAGLKLAGVPNPNGLEHGVNGVGGTVGALFDNASAKYDAAIKGNTFTPDAQTVSDMAATRAKYLGPPGQPGSAGNPGLYGADTEDAVRAAMLRVTNVIRANGGTMPAADYQTLRSSLNTAAMGAPAAKAKALGEVIDNLDNTMSRSIAATNPAGAGAFDDARDAYRRALTIKEAANMAGPGIAQENISPAQLSAASASIYGDRYNGAQNPFADLSRAGQAVLRTPSTTMTSERARINGMLTGVGAAGGAILGGGSGVPDANVLGLLLGETVGQPIVRGAAKLALMNPVTQGWLKYQGATHVPGLLSTTPGALSVLRTANQIPGLFSPPQP